MEKERGRIRGSYKNRSLLAVDDDDDLQNPRPFKIHALNR